MASAPNSLVAERGVPLAFLPPFANTSARNTLFVDVSNYRRLEVTFKAGASTAAGTFIVRRSSTAGSGTGAENASATMAWGGTSTTGDNIMQVVELDPAVYKTDAKPFLGIQSSATAGSVTSIEIRGYDPRYAPASDDAADDVIFTPAPAVA